MPLNQVVHEQQFCVVKVEKRDFISTRAVKHNQISAKSVENFIFNNGNERNIYVYDYILQKQHQGATLRKHCQTATPGPPER